MEALLIPYILNFSDFTQQIRDCRAVVAGSFALAGYLRQIGIDPGFEPNDMDIFVSGVEGNDSLKKLTTFLISQGYKQNGKYNSNNTNGDYYAALKRIQRVESFTNANNKEIQIIILNTSADNLIGDIHKNFDLSCCQCFWQASTNVFHAISSLTKEKKMYVNFCRNKDQLEKRIQKYQARGFKLLRPPCPVMDRADPRSSTDLASFLFDNRTAHNILTMEDVPIREFLAECEWNILLKAGEQFYAFERKTLMDLMYKKATHIPGVGLIYDTPLNQSITSQAHTSLKYSDYSIYELKHAYTTNVGSTTKSLHTVIAYSVKQWINGVEGKRMAPPRRELTPPSVPELHLMLRRIAGLFVGTDPREVIRAHPGLIPSCCVDEFMGILRELNSH